MLSLELYVNIKFCTVLEKSSSEKLEILKKKHRNNAMKKLLCTNDKCFCEGRTKFCLDKIRWKVVLEVFFHYKGIIHYEFISEVQTINKKLYLDILKWLWDVVRKTQPGKWAINNWFLLHNNAPPHHAVIVKNYLARHNVTTLRHPLYIPDLEPDFLPVSTAENEIERTLFYEFRLGDQKCAEATEGYLTR